jgi:CubicO group peptidase (beta-lactamase class C family)
VALNAQHGGMTSSHARPSRRALVGAGLAVSVAAAASTAVAASASSSPASPPAPVPPLDTAALRAAIGDLAHPPATAAQLRVGGSAGRWYGTSGVADIVSGRPVRPDDTVRVGSITKVFVATVVLQLAAERRLDLDTPIQRYLPGLLPADFRPITVAQLLNHTSGLPDHAGIPEPETPEEVFRHRFDQWTPREWVATATRLPMKFEPGTRQEYRGVNYVLAAMLIDEVTGRPYGDAVAARILRPLGLARTVVPGDDPYIHGPHVHGYLRMTDGGLRDITAYNTSSSRGEGDIVSTTSDLDRLATALFSGALLPPPALRRMFTLPPDGVRMLDGSPARYSMGLQTATVNGVTFWGKTGEQYGYSSAMFATRDGQRRFVLSFNPTTARDGSEDQMVIRVVEALTS